MTAMDRQTQRALELAREAKNWPTIQEVADAYGLDYRHIRHAIASQEIVAFKLNVLRVDPDSFAAWLVQRQDAVTEYKTR
jgi:hypothetical protein